MLCTPRTGVTIDGPAHVKTGLNTTTYRAQTDAAGRFSLAAAPAPQDLIAIHGEGFAQLSLAAFEAAGSITLQPWGRVEGSLVLDSQPVSGERIVAYNQVCRYDEQGRRFGVVTLSLETTTDSGGRFSFEKVPPGECSIFRQKVLSREIRAGFESHETSVVISAGMVTQVALGGTGRPIVGNALLPGATGAVDWQSVPVNLRLKTAYEPGLRPRRDDFASNEPFIQAMDRWVEARRAQQRFGAFCDSNGSFRLPDIPGGTYELKIELRDYKLDSVSPHDLSDPAPVIASLIREVIVPEVSGGEKKEPLDLGTLELVPKRDSARAQ